MNRRFRTDNVLMNAVFFTLEKVGVEDVYLLNGVICCRLDGRWHSMKYQNPRPGDLPGTPDLSGPVAVVSGPVDVLVALGLMPPNSRSKPKPAQAAPRRLPRKRKPVQLAAAVSAVS